MLKKLEYICLVASIALIGADRIDLLGGYGFFKLSPFIFFASFVILIRLFLIGLRGTFQVPINGPLRRQILFLIVLALFLFIAFASTIFGLDPQRGLIALGGLMLLSILGYCVSARILADPAPEKLITRSVTLALLVWLIFCIGEGIAFNYGLFRSQGEPGLSIASIFAPTSTLLWAPRLSGSCLDANRAGFILVMYLALLDRFASRTRYTRFLHFALAFFVLLTLSRSAMLCWFAYYFFSKAFWNRLTTRRVAFTAATIAIVASLFCFAYRKEIADLLELWEVSDMMSSRLSGEEGSSGGDHLELIQRGFDTWSTSTHTIVAGIGFAGAPRVLGDFFGDDKYGNFHCLYMTVLAELGLPAFVLFLILLGYPIVGRKGIASCIAAIAVFNVPYQSHMEPIFWVVLALVWSYEPKNRGPHIFPSATEGLRSYA
ncbi:MAG: O-antigen ligase family protein [Candidatus Sulfotelmatobacter sp.]